MTCRHSDPVNNKDCSSYMAPWEQLAQLEKQSKRIREKFDLSDTPDNSKFEITDVFEHAKGVIVTLKYESCENCSYEGTKILVYKGITIMDILKWKIIDPHFSDKTPGAREAPSPIARFPASNEGYDMAKNFLMNL